VNRVFLMAEMQFLVSRVWVRPSRNDFWNQAICPVPHPKMVEIGWAIEFCCIGLG